MRTPAGEVDLVALDAQGRAVAVEVKTGRVPHLAPLPDPLLRPGRRLDRRGLERRLAAARFLAGRLELPAVPGPRGDPGGPRDADRRRVRVDLVEVLVAARGAVRLLHHRDLREPPLALPGFPPPTPRERGRERGPG